MSSAKQSSPWVWISLILIISLFVFFIFFLDQKVVKSGRQTIEQPELVHQIQKPRIDFYEVLKERNFSVPDDRKEQVRNAKAKADVIKSKQNKLSSDTRYILQAGSFKKAEDAERRKAELAMLGLESSVKKVNVAGTFYHRVEMGPFLDDGFYSRVKNRLISSDIQYIARTANK
jgi:cell division protein FtsN